MATITVKIVDSDDAPLDATVELAHRYNNEDTISTETTQGGTYTFSNVLVGRYVVIPSADGYFFDPDRVRADIEDVDTNFTVPTFVAIAAQTSDMSIGPAQISQVTSDFLTAVLAALPAWNAKSGAVKARALALETITQAFTPPAVVPHPLEAAAEAAVDVAGEEGDAVDVAGEEGDAVDVAWCLNRYDTPGTPYYHNAAALAQCLEQTGEEPGEHPMVTSAYCVDQYNNRASPVWHNKLALAQCLALAGRSAEEETEENDERRKPQIENGLTPTYCVNRYNTPGTQFYHNGWALQFCLSQCG